MKFLFIFNCLIHILNCQSISAAETCSRIAIINFQEVLVDTSSTQKGESLKYHLEKDPKAKMYLEAYQKGIQTKWQSAALGTAGTSLMLGSLITHNKEKQKTFLIGGAILIAINFFVTKTLENTNENNLIKAIEEYNKKNLPKIYLNSSNDDLSSKALANISIRLDKSWSF